MLSKTNKVSFDLKIWNKNYFEDELYSISIFYFVSFHVIFLLLLISLIKTSLKSPGYLDEKYVK